MENQQTTLADGVIDADAVIIGAGPVGLFAVFQCGMLGLSCHVIDSLDVIGGQCSALYPEKPIYDIPAYPQIVASELIDRLAEQAAPFAPVYHLGQQAQQLEPLATGGWRVITSTGTTIEAGAVIIAAGGGAFVCGRAYPGGGTGRRTGLKIRSHASGVRVRFPPRVLCQTPCVPRRSRSPSSAR